MDEQTTQQEQSQQFQQQQVTNQEAEQQDKEEPTLQEDAPQVEQQQSQEEPEIGITEDGEVTFKDGFFGDFSKKAEEDVTNKQPSTTTPQQTTPNYYTDEELQNIPFEQWDMARMPEEVRRYAEVLNKQREIQFKQQRAQQQAEQIRNTPMPNLLGEEPKPYTPKELVESANKLAMERLKIKEDDFDPEYDAEHRAAVDIAKNDLIQQRNYEAAVYRQKATEFNDLMNFNANLVKIPDYDKFSEWYDNAIQKIGKTNQQVQNELVSVAQQRGCYEVMRIIQSWYKTFKQQAAQQAQAVEVKPQKEKAKIPPKLESTQGGNTSNRKTYNMRDFGQLDDDAQAQALIDMGIVK